MLLLSEHERVPHRPSLADSMPLQVTMNGTSFVSSFFSYGLLAMRGVGGYAGWRWLFLFEGIITVLVGGLAFCLMVSRLPFYQHLISHNADFTLLQPAGPSQTKRPWSKKPFLNERQTKIAVARVLRDEPQKSSMHNREGLQLKMILRTVANWRLWPVYVLGVLFGIPQGPIQQYLTLSLRNLGFSTLLTQVLSSIQYLGAIFSGIGVVLLSEFLDERALVCMAEDLWVLPFLIAIFKLSADVNAW